MAEFDGFSQICKTGIQQQQQASAAEFGKIPAEMSMSFGARNRGQRIWPAVMNLRSHSTNRKLNHTLVQSYYSYYGPAHDIRKEPSMRARSATDNPRPPGLAAVLLFTGCSAVFCVLCAPVPPLSCPSWFRGEQPLWSHAVERLFPLDKAGRHGWYAHCD
jgi:hypothetical protein